VGLGAQQLGSARSSKGTSFGGGRFVVPTKVPSVGVSSNSQCIPQDIPNNTTILPRLLWSKLNFHVYKLQRGESKGNHLCAPIGSAEFFKKKRSDVPIKVAPSKNFGHTLQLAIKKDEYTPINYSPSMNMTKSEQNKVRAYLNVTTWVDHNGWPIKNTHLGLLALLETHGM